MEKQTRIWEGRGWTRWTAIDKAEVYFTNMAAQNRQCVYAVIIALS